jgi:hypothetical protein
MISIRAFAAVFTVLFLLVALFAQSGSVDAHDTKDQAFEPTDVNDAGRTYSWLPPVHSTQRTGQQFVPTMPILTGVDVALVDANPAIDTGVPSDITALIREGSLNGAIVGVLGGRSLIEAAAVELGSVEVDDKEFDKAVKHLEKALPWDNWIDEGHPDTKHGKKVFDEVRHAIKHL